MKWLWKGKRSYNLPFPKLTDSLLKISLSKFALEESGHSLPRACRKSARNVIHRSLQSFHCENNYTSVFRITVMQFSVHLLVLMFYLYIFRAWHEFWWSSYNVLHLFFVIFKIIYCEHLIFFVYVFFLCIFVEFDRSTSVGAMLGLTSVAEVFF